MAKVTRNNPKKGGKNVYRFYKSKLPAVIWNPKRNGPLVEFVNGQFETTDAKLAEKLIDLGYPQVNPQAVEPPNITRELPGHSLDDNQNVGLTGENTSKKPITPITVK